MSYNVKWIRSRIRWPIIWLTISNFMIFMQSRNILGGAPRRRTNVDMALALYGARITCREVIQTIKCFTPQFHLPRDKFSFYLLSFLRWILEETKPLGFQWQQTCTCTMALAQPSEVRLKRSNGCCAVKIGSGNVYFYRGRKEWYDPRASGAHISLGKLKCHAFGI